MKWLELCIGLALLMPCANFLKQNKNYRLIAWMAVGFLPFVIARLHLYMAVDSAAVWTGYVKGAELSGLDLVAAALYLSLPRSTEPLPFRIAMLGYFIAIFLSIFHALVPMEVVFDLWQLARMFLVYATVARGTQDPDVTWAVLKGMAAGLILEAVIVGWQRFVSHMIQTPGTMETQNLLGLMTHFVVLPFCALFLSGKRGILPPLVILAGILVDLSTASRGTIGLLGIGIILVFAISAAKRWTSRKASAIMIGVVALALLAPLAAASLQERFSKSSTSYQDSDYDERAVYKSAALRMLADHPFGVGANHFAVIGNVSGYYTEVGLGQYFLGRSGNVHNVYYLTTAEAGYVGLVALLILFFRPMIVAFRCGWNNDGDDRGDLLIGFGAALSAVYLHSWVEWILVTFPPQYLLAITMGLVAGNAQALGYWSSVGSKSKRWGRALMAKSSGTGRAL